MTRTPSFCDVEKLSAYLDGQLKPSEIARLEVRLKTDPELASVLKDLRETRSVLRQLPQRRAPRNFTLTPKMVGQKPPMPRTYPVFRFATVLATLLLFFTFATNFMAPRLVRTAAPYQYGIGGGGGGGDAEPELAMEAPLQDLAEPAEAPAPAEEPVEEPVMEESAAPEAAEEPASAPTEGAATTLDDSARAEPTMQPNGMEKSAPGEAYAQDVVPDTEAHPAQPLIGATWQILLAGIALLSALVSFSLRYTTIRKWRAKAK